MKRLMRWLSETGQSFVVLEVYFIFWPLIKGVMEVITESQGNGTFNQAYAIMQDVYSSITEGVAFSDRLWMMWVICMVGGWLNSKLRGIPGWVKSLKS